MPKIKVEYVVPNGELCGVCKYKEVFAKSIFGDDPEVSSYMCTLFHRFIRNGDKKSILCKTAEVS